MAITATSLGRLFDVLMKVKLTAATPPPPPFGRRPTVARVQALVDAGAQLLPKLFRDSYSAPLAAHLKPLVSQSVAAGDLTTLETLTGAVYQHNQRVGKTELHRFLAVISNLYRSFLDEKKRTQAQFPLRETLPPMAMFQNRADDGPFTMTVDVVNQLFGAAVGVVSLPAAYRDHPFFWAALAHETGGHDVLHADPALLSELSSGVRNMFGAASRNLGLLWAYWMDEAASDVYGVLNVGPSFGLSLTAFFAALLAQLNRPAGKVPVLRTQAGGDEFGRLDPHPIDILRLHLILGVVENLEGLSQARRQQYSEDLLALAEICAGSATSVELEGRVKLDSGETLFLRNSFPLIDMQDAARRVGAFIATAELNALGGHRIQDVETWDDPDEEKAIQVAAAVESGKAITGIGDDAQLLAGVTLALYENPNLYSRATTLLAAGLDESFDNDPFWGSAKPDRALTRPHHALTVRRPKYDVDPLAQELIEYRSEAPGHFEAADAMGLAARITGPTPIPWPKGQAPQAIPMKKTLGPDAPLPRCDYIAITWTVDEANAMASVLTPGYVADPPSGDKTAKPWLHYAHNYNDYRPHIRPMAPAWNNHLLGRYFMSRFAGKDVICYKSELHLGQDGPGFPLKDLFKQLIEETKAKLVITTGTAGAIGPHVQLGDVIVANHCLFHCKRTFGSAPFNGKTYTSNVVMPGRGVRHGESKTYASQRPSARSTAPWGAENLLGQRSVGATGRHRHHRFLRLWQRAEYLRARGSRVGRRDGRCGPRHGLLGNEESAGLAGHSQCL